jgi:hypothetical protein
MLLEVVSLLAVQLGVVVYQSVIVCKVDPLPVMIAGVVDHRARLVAAA